MLTIKKSCFTLLTFFIMYATVVHANNETIYVHTDKDSYLAGEIVWFKIYTVDTKTSIPTKESSTIYIEIINKEGNAILKTKVQNEGNGSGSIAIPSHILNGVYNFVAYTLETKSQNTHFSKTISIYNPTIQAERGSLKKPTSDLQVFPEGGNLINQIPTRLGFKLVDSDGYGTKHTLKLINLRDGSEIKSESNHLGLGSFSFTPNMKDSYSITAVVNGKVVAECAMPNISQFGYNLSAISSGDYYKVNVKATKDLSLSGLYLTYLDKTGSIKRILSKITSENQIEANLPKSDLQSGTSVLTLFKENNVPVAERVLFSSSKNTLKIETKNLKNTYEKRSKVSLNISSFLEEAETKSTLSVAVRKLDDLSGLPQNNIISELLLKKNILGNIENPSWYFLDGNVKEKDLENLLLTQAWREIKEASEAEQRYHHIKLRFTSKESNKPIQNENVLLSIPGKSAQVFASTTNENGEALFYVKNLFGNVQIATKLASNHPANVELIPENLAKSSFQLETKSADIELVNTYSINTQLQNNYWASTQNLFSVPSRTDSLSFYGTPDVQYELDAYTRFPTLNDVLKEFVKEVRVRRKDNTSVFQIFNKQFQNFFENPPLILLDGVPLDNPSELIDYSALRIKRFEVVQSLFSLGDVQYQGILQFFTYDGDLKDFKLSPATTLLYYEGPQYNRTFYSPKYEVPNSRKPDLRTLHYWTPNYNTASEEEIVFFTSDIEGNYIIDIQGISKDGVPASKIVEYKVK